MEPIAFYQQLQQLLQSVNEMYDQVCWVGCCEMMEIATDASDSQLSGKNKCGQ